MMTATPPAAPAITITLGFFEESFSLVTSPASGTVTLDNRVSYYLVCLIEGCSHEALKAEILYITGSSVGHFEDKGMVIRFQPGLGINQGAALWIRIRSPPLFYRRTIINSDCVNRIRAIIEETIGIYCNSKGM